MKLNILKIALKGIWGFIKVLKDSFWLDLPAPHGQTLAPNDPCILSSLDNMKQEKVRI